MTYLQGARRFESLPLRHFSPLRSEAQQSICQLTWQIGHEPDNFVRHFRIHESFRGDRFSPFRLVGSKRVRKNFPTRVEAEAERQVLEVQRLQGETGIRTVVTRLTEDQLHEAESAFHRLVGLSRSLSFYLNFALTTYREPATQKLLTEAITEYVATKQHEHEQDLLSEPHLTRMKWDLKRWKSTFRARP